MELQRHIGLQTDGEQARLDGRHGISVLPSVRRFAVLTCMDSRVDSSKLKGRPGSEAHIIRNAGARVTEDAIRSLLFSSKLLGTREWFVVQHSHCGMALLSEEVTDNLWSSHRLHHACHNHADVLGSSDGLIGQLKLTAQPDALAADVARIRKHPAVPAEIPVRGFIFSHETDRFYEVPAGDLFGF